MALAGGAVIIGGATGAASPGSSSIAGGVGGAKGAASPGSTSVAGGIVEKTGAVAGLFASLSLQRQLPKGMQQSTHTPAGMLKYVPMSSNSA